MKKLKQCSTVFDEVGVGRLHFHKMARDVLLEKVTFELRPEYAMQIDTWMKSIPHRRSKEEKV